MVETTVQPAAEGAVGGTPKRADPLADLSVLQRVSTAGLIPAGETVILALKPSRWFVMLSRGGLFVVWGIAMLAAWYFGPMLDMPIGTRGLQALVLAAGVAALLWSALDWQTRLYLLTDRRMVRVAGIIRQTVREVPLRNVQSVTMSRSARERLTGIGSLGVSSAGSDGYEVTWRMVSRPREALRVVREAVERYGRDGAP